jgi:hypothetical protein
MVGKVGGWKLSVVGLIAAVLVAGVAQTQGTKDSQKLEAFLKKLEKKGFIVQEGSVDFPPILEMGCQCQLPSCYGNNKSSSYGLFALPPAPNQDPYVKNPYDEWFTEDGTLPAGWSYWWRMRPDEAVVFLGATPPKVDYYGLTAYLYDRYVTNLPPGANCECQSGNHCPRPQPDSSLHRYPVYSSLGDTVNPLTINLPGGRHNPYEKNAAFIMAADRNTEGEVRKALIAAGYPAEGINLLPVSPSLVRLGLESENDTVSLLLRVAPVPGTDITPYYSAPKTLLRISPGTPVPPEKLDPIPPPKLRIRGTGKTEVSLLPALDALEQAIIAKYPTYTATPIKMAIAPEGYNCLENLVKAMADNRDTVYISPGYDTRTEKPFQDLTLKEGSGEFYVAYGVIHPKMNKATYSNISVMGWQRRAAPVMISNPDMVGSAQYYLGPDADPATADKIYAFKIARPGGYSGESFCKEIGYGCGTGIASDEDIALIFRAYLEPATKVGPAWGEIILDRILKFTPRAMTGLEVSKSTGATSKVKP